MGSEVSPTSDSDYGTLSDMSPNQVEVNSKSIEAKKSALPSDKKVSKSRPSKSNKVSRKKKKTIVNETENGSNDIVSASLQFPLNPSPDFLLETDTDDSSGRRSISPGSVEIKTKYVKIPVRCSDSPSSIVTPDNGQIQEEPKQQEPQLPSPIVPNGCPETPKANGTSNDKSPSSIFDKIKLPETITRLKSPEGSEVFLVGTAHFSKESQDDVTKIINEVHPDVVVLELCKSRIAILKLDEEAILSESKNLNFAKLRQCLAQNGTVQGILYFLMLSVSAHFTKQLGMAPGGEFRAAYNEAVKSVPHCQIYLGDRPISITLGRALGFLSVWAKIKLMWKIMCSKEPISKEEVEKCKERDFIEEMLSEMTGEFPVVSRVFVDERDLYLTKSLQLAAVPSTIPPPVAVPSQRSGRPWVVVGVVGIGHMSGIVKNWGKVSDEEVAAIMEIPPPSLASRVVKISLKLGFYSGLGFVAYKCIPRAMKASLLSTISRSSEALLGFITK